MLAVMNARLSMLLAGALLSGCAASQLPGVPTNGACGLESVTVRALGME